MTNQKSFVKPVAMVFCLLILAFSSSRVANGQKGQQPDKRRGPTEDYVIIDGDIQVSLSFYQELVAAARSPQAAPLRYDVRLWPDGVVPFEFNSNVSEDNRTKMIKAMADLEAIANVDFRHCGDNDCGDNYVHIRDSDKNSSWVGRKGTSIFNWDGRQDIDILSWNSPHAIKHELLHCLGFFHEQSRPDRNNYIRINCNNIKGGCGSDLGENFKIKSDSTSYGRYDFGSVMHYDQCAGSKSISCPIPTAEFPDGGVTITVLPPNDTEWQKKIGIPPRLSELDRAALSFLYPFPGRRFLDVSYDGDRGSSIGSFLRPYTDFADAVAKTPEGGTLWLLRTQTIPAMGTYGKNITVKAAPNVEATLGG